MIVKVALRALQELSSGLAQPADSRLAAIVGDVPLTDVCAQGRSA
jgi:hypothetical protein